MNVTEVVFSGFYKTQICGLYQYDYGQVLKFTDITLPSTYEVHFAQSGASTTVTVLGDSNGVQIPDQYLLADLDIRAYIYLHEEETDGETVYQVLIPVIARPEPTDVEPTPVEQDIITQAIAALNIAVEKSSQSASDSAESAEASAQSAQSASDSATASAQSAQSALDSANRASASEASASASAQSAQQSATSASASAQSAKGYAEQAEASATNAETSETNARTSAQTASAKASEASASASNAQTSASNAQASATSAGTSASSASASAQTASTKASEASDSATSASESASTAVSAKDDAVTAKEEAETAKADAETAAEEAQESAQTVANKADKDGTYPDMTVGGVMSSGGSTDSTPYLYRVSGGGVEVGAVEEDSIVGGTVAFNQLINYASASTRTVNGVTFTYDGSGKVTVNGTATAVANYSLNRVDYLDGHKYMMLGIPQSTGCSAFLFAENFTRPSVKAPQKSDYFTARIRVANGTTVSNAVFHLLLIDLTQMFGSAVADMIYNMEKANTGSGVAFFRSLFPNEYYPYNTGELKSVEGLQNHDMVGFNQWDEEWEVGGILASNGQNTNVSNSIRSTNYIPCVPNTEYGLSVTTGMQIYFYNADKSYLAYNGQLQSGTFTTPSDCYFIRFRNNTTATYKNDICINISSDRNGEYEPYVKHSYPLDSSLTLRGIPKVADGKMYYDGDIYSADGKVQRKYGIVDLGTLNWSFDSTNNVFQSQALVKTGTEGTPIICDRYVARPYGYNGSYSTEDKIIYVHAGSGSLMVRDSSYTDAATFKTAMSGVMLVYELATQTEETAQAYTEYQKVSKYGTEEYVSTSVVPVGHVTKYPTDIISKVNGLPSDFSTLIAPTETGFKATRAYSVNQFLIVNNQLYRVTSAIASGATITVGTNVTATTVADILTALLNA